MGRRSYPMSTPRIPFNQYRCTKCRKWIFTEFDDEQHRFRCRPDDAETDSNSPASGQLAFTSDSSDSLANPMPFTDPPPGLSGGGGESGGSGSSVSWDSGSSSFDSGGGGGDS